VTLDDEALFDLVETLGTVIQQFIEAHPDTPMDQVAAAVSFVQGSMFRLAIEIPPNKLH
jgi:hypothetical protein